MKVTLICDNYDKETVVEFDAPHRGAAALDEALERTIEKEGWTWKWCSWVMHDDGMFCPDCSAILNKPMEGRDAQ